MNRRQRRKKEKKEAERLAAGWRRWVWDASAMTGNRYIWDEFCRGENQSGNYEYTVTITYKTASGETVQAPIKEWYAPPPDAPPFAPGT